MDFDTRNTSLHKEPFLKSASLKLTKIREHAIKPKILTEVNISNRSLGNKSVSE